MNDDRIRIVTERSGTVSAAYRRLIGPLCGVVRDVRSNRPARGAPELFTSFTETTTPHGQRLTGFGTGSSRPESIDRGIESTLVRYCLNVGPAVETRHAPSGDLPTVPEVSVLLENGPDTDEHREWWKGTDIQSGDTCWVPPALLPSEATTSPTPRCAIGYGCDTTLPAAVLDAVFSCLSRDAAMRTWLTRTIPPRYRLESDPTVRRLVDDRFPADSLSVYAFALDSPSSLATVGCLVADQQGQPPGIAVGLATDLDETKGLRKALVRAGGRWIRAKHVLGGSSGSIDDAGDPFATSVVQYTESDLREELGFLVAGDYRPIDRSTRPTDPAERLGRTLDRLGIGTPVYLPLTTDDVAETGAVVVAVLIPELLPLDPPTRLSLNHPNAPAERRAVHPHPFGGRTV